MKRFSTFAALALVALAVSAQTTRTIYLDANIWATDDNPVFAVHVWNTGDEDAADYWMTKVDGNIYKADIKDDATSAIFLRKNPADPEVETNIWGGEWNRAETSIPTDKNQFRITAWHEGDDDKKPSVGEWGTYGDTPSDPQPADKVIVKVKKPAGWEKIAAYEWATGKKDVDLLGAWPGTEMQSLGDDWYGLHVYADANLILNNNGSGEQANDYAVKEAVCLENIANKQDVSVTTDCASVPDPTDGGTPPPSDPAKDITIKVKKLADWAGLSIWAWGSKDATWQAQFTAWPGVPMTALADDWYEFTVKDDATFMFNDGVEGTSNKTEAKTSKENACYTINPETQKNIEEQDEHPLISVDCSTVPQPEGVEVIRGGESSSLQGGDRGRLIFHNGQLFIIHDGKMYNATGAEVK